MDDIWEIFTSWQFLLVGVVVWMVFAFFNRILGPRLWKIQGGRWRRFMRFLEGIKLMWPPLIGFGLAWIPGMPRPETLSESSTLTAALLYAVAGLCCQWVVQAVKKYLESRGINVDIDLDPREQKRERLRW